MKLQLCDMLEFLFKRTKNLKANGGKKLACSNKTAPKYFYKSIYKTTLLYSHAPPQQINRIIRKIGLGKAELYFAFYGSIQTIAQRLVKVIDSK